MKTLYERMADLQREPRPDSKPFALTTCDPRFSPNEPLTVNGFRFIPAPK